MALDQLWVAPGTNSAQPGELCAALVLPNTPTGSGSAYVRLEYRRAMEIAVVGAAAALVLDGGRLRSIRVPLTAVAATIVEVAGLDALIGRPVDADLLAAVSAAAAKQATPISDLRASDRYRRHTVGVMPVERSTPRRAAGESIAVPVNRALGIGAAR